MSQELIDRVIIGSAHTPNTNPWGFKYRHAHQAQRHICVNTHVGEAIPKKENSVTYYTLRLFHLPISISLFCPVLLPRKADKLNVHPR